MAVNLGALQNIRPLPDLLVRARSLADLRAQQQEEVTREQEQQLNALNIEGKTAANQEWAKVRSIFDKHSGDKEGAISEILQTPWRSKEITDTYQGEADRMRKDAISNAGLKQGQIAPSITATAPQTTTAPIQTSLTDTTQMSTPEVSPAGIQAVPLPVQPTKIPFGGPTVQTQTAQQLIRAKRDELQYESGLKTQQAIAEKQAAIDAAAEEAQAKTVDTAEGIFQWNPATKKYDIRVGGSKGKTPTFEELTADEWLKNNPGKTRNDYQDMDAARKRATTVINGSNTPGNFAKTGEEFLATIPAQWRTTVKKIANYDEDPTKVASMRGGMREQMMQWVNQVNPEYDTTLYVNRAPTRKAFTTGTQGQQINAINTAIGHIDQLPQVAAALKNGSFIPGNELYNRFKTAFGEPAVTNFETLKDALAGEVASVLSKGSATVSGIAAEKAKMGSANSPEQLAGYVKTLIPVMGSKLEALNYQYHQAMGDADPFSALSKESKAILVKNGIDPEHPLGTSPTTSTSPSGIEVNPKTGQYRRKSGSGFEYSDDKGSTWHK